MTINTEAALTLPQPPATGMVRHESGVLWRHHGNGIWCPDPCASCGSQAGPLTWPELLSTGPLTEVS